MPIFLKKIKRDLAANANLVGVNAQGELNHTPPTAISRDMGNYTRLRIVNLDRTVHISSRSVDFVSLVQSESQPGRRYRAEISFVNIVMSGQQKPELTNQTPVTAGKHVGRTAYWKTPAIAANPVKLRCSCMDFRHRFSHELDAHDALIGQPIPYDRETPPWEQGGMPYANSLGKVGICKHLYSLIIHLKARGLITER